MLEAQLQRYLMSLLSFARAHFFLSSLPSILDKLRADLRETKKDREVVGAKTPTNTKERVSVYIVLYIFGN